MLKQKKQNQLSPFLRCSISLPAEHYNSVEPLESCVEMCWSLSYCNAQGEKNHSSSGGRFIRFFPEPSRVKFLWRLFGFQMLFSLTPSQPCYSVQTCLHLLLMFFCMVDVLLKRPISNKSLFLFCWLIFSVFMNSGLSHGNG